MTLNYDIDDMFNPILNILRAALLVKVKNHLIAVYLSADRELVSWGKTKLGKPIYYEGPPMEQAIKYADARCAELIKGMDEETKSRIAQVISDGIENKRGVDGIARDIRGMFDDMTRDRAVMISRTETADALEDAFIWRSKAMGVTGKEWVSAPGCCDLCDDNAATGVIPINDLFPSGALRPPEHPNCKCALAPAMLEEK